MLPWFLDVGAVAGFQVSHVQPEPVRNALDQAIGQANELIKEYLGRGVAAITSARGGQENPAQQNGPHGFVRGWRQG